MKKAYHAPTTEVLKLCLHGLLMASGVQSSDGQGIGYGGVDEAGDRDPAARRRRDVWSDDGDDEG